MSTRKPSRDLVPLTGDELRALVRRREEILRAEERTYIDWIVERAEPEMQARLRRLLGWEQ